MTEWCTGLENYFLLSVAHSERERVREKDGERVWERERRRKSERERKTDKVWERDKEIEK